MLHHFHYPPLPHPNAQIAVLRYRVHPKSVYHKNTQIKRHNMSNALVACDIDRCIQKKLSDMSQNPASIGCSTIATTSTLQEGRRRDRLEMQGR
jgi:hypothetical protein